MFREVIAGVDGKPNSRDAVALAGQLVGDGARLTLAHVYDDRSLVGADVADLERHDSLELLAREREEASVDADLVAVPARSVGAGLHEIAERREADLLVVGSCSRGALGRLLLGDDRRASLDGAPCAVAIAPSGYARAPRPIARIGVAYDGTPESEHALALARSVAEQRNSSISALTVVSVPTYSYGTMAAVDWGAVVEGMAQAARERLAGLEGVSGHVVRGVAVEELAAWSSSVDLLIVGSRGYGPVRRVVFGSTSEYLARSTECPLLVLRRGLPAVQAAGAAPASALA